MESSLSRKYLVYRMRLGLYSLHLSLLVASGGCEVGSSAIAPENSEIGPNRILRWLQGHTHTIGPNSLPFLFSLSNDGPLNTQHFSPVILQRTPDENLKHSKYAKPGKQKHPNFNMNSPQWLHFQREVEFQRWNALTLVIWSLKMLSFHISSHSDLPYRENHLLKYIILKAGRQRIMDPRSTKGTFRSILEVRGTIHMQASNGRVLRE